MNRTKIDWAQYSWNPITGCKRGCDYCYARRIHERFWKTQFSEIVFHEDRIDEPLKVKKPSTIFVGSMSDVQYWKLEWLCDIFGVCVRAPQHTFMFLSKDRLAYMGLSWPENTMQGLTLDCTTDAYSQGQAVGWIHACPRPWLSIEPLLGEFYAIPSYCERVIVGAMTGPGAVKPKPEWIQSIRDLVPEDKLFWKDNIREYL